MAYIKIVFDSDGELPELDGQFVKSFVDEVIELTKNPDLAMLIDPENEITSTIDALNDVEERGNGVGGSGGIRPYKPGPSAG